MSGFNNPIKTVNATNNALINGVLSGDAWAGQIDYSFPDNVNAYIYDNAPPEYQNIVANAFLTTAAQKTAVHFALNADVGPTASAGFSLEGFTAVNVFHQSTNVNAQNEIRIANTDSASPPTAQVTDFPGNYVTNTVFDNGDVWFGNFSGGTYTSPQAGNFAWHTHIHELGHAVGLTHGHTSFFYQALPTAFDSMEYSIMTYRSYVNGPTSGYTNEFWGFAQTFMMADIAALQHMYGADFTTNSGNTTYKWNPGSGDTLVNGAVGIDAGGNRIFATIWDGGGIDVFDLSSYGTNLMVNLAPGKHSVFDSTQLAGLGNGNFARGNIFNALQYQGDQRSLIENVQGGSGNDTIFGNQANNGLVGNNGNDKLYGQTGNDLLIGGSGNDKLYGNNGTDNLRGGSGDDTLYANGIQFSGVGANDKLFGGADNDYLVGGKWRDELYGENGNDTLVGGNGNDVMWGDGFNNVGTGNDLMSGQNGNDRMIGGNGDDKLLGGNQNDTLFGDLTNNQGDGDDRLFGNDGNDILGGGGKHDILYGGNHNDLLYGHSGNDILIGDFVQNSGFGNDKMYGGYGNDTMYGGRGNDYMVGGPGIDRYVIESAMGSDTIAFENGPDTVDFSRVAIVNNFAQLSPFIGYGPAGALINFGAGNQILLLGMRPVDIDASDFTF